MAGDLPQQLNVREGTRYQHNVAGTLAKNAVRDGNIAAAGVPDWAIHLSSEIPGNPVAFVSVAATIRASERPKIATYTNCSTFETAGRSANNVPI
jgi:hypothetical protein